MATTPWWQDLIKTIEKSSTSVDKTNLQNFNSDFSKEKNAIASAGSIKTNIAIPTSIEQTQKSVQDTIGNIQEISGRGITKQALTDVSNLRPENKYEQDLRAGLSGLKDYTTGNSLVDRAIANRALNRFDASQAASNISQAQRIASNPMLSAGAKTAAIADVNRMASSQRSELTGQLAQQAQERAFGATRDYTQLSQQAAQYEEQKFQSDINTVSNNLNRELQGAIATGGLQSDILNNQTNIWGKQIDAQLADASRALSAAVSIGELTNNEAALNFSKISKILDTNIQELSLNLEKMKSIADIGLRGEGLEIDKQGLELDKQRFDLDKSQIENNKRMIDAQIAQIHSQLTETYRSAAATTLLNMKLTNPNLTSDNIKNNAYALQQVTEYFRSTGYDGQITDTMISSFLSQIKTPSEAERELTVDSINSLRQKYPNIPTDQMNSIVNLLNLTNDFGAGTRIDNDGNIIISNIDGTPYITIGKDGKLVVSEPSIVDETEETISIPYGIQSGDSFVDNGIVYTNENGVAKAQTSIGDIGTTKIINDKIYEVAESNKVIEIKPDTNDWFSEDNTKILSAGEDSNPYYKTILDNQFSEITNGKDIFSSIDKNRIFKNGTLYSNALQSELEKITSSFENNEDINGLSYDNPLIQKLKEKIEEESKDFFESLGYKEGEYGYVTIVKDGNTWKFIRRK
jgi:hypothetical protein